jgi:FKBP-type peptidyl-prolyl cis-trans isomerase FkpA
LKHSTTLCLALVLSSAVAGCSDSPTGPKDPTELEFAPSLNVDLDEMSKTSSGLYYQDLVVGEGDEAVAGDSVTVFYTGWLHDGTQFDSNVGGDPITFDLDEVIQGWKEGVPGMRVGGQRKLVIPSTLAYGAQGAGGGVIPPHATLVFDIELLGIGG